MNKEYRVIQTADGLKRLEYIVNTHLDAGWELQGGVCAVGPRSTEDGKPYWLQAMVRDNNTKPT